LLLNSSHLDAVSPSLAGTGLLALRASRTVSMSEKRSRDQPLAAFLLAATAASASLALATRSGRGAGFFSSEMVRLMAHRSTFLSKLTAAKLERVCVSLALTALKYWSTTLFSGWPQAAPSRASTAAAATPPRVFMPPPCPRRGPPDAGGCPRPPPPARPGAPPRRGGRPPRAG